jgi:uncharacterized membrane protein (UPF0127 family)
MSMIGAPKIKQLACAAAVASACLAISFSIAGGAEKQLLEIASKTGKHVFSVELAVTEDERQRGLMFRRSVPEFYGMLFDFERDQEVTMWMKNTFVSLDMIFIESDGRIRTIAENTEVKSEKVISSRGPVRAVLEVVAGTARKLGIQPGDRVDSPILLRR